MGKKNKNKKNSNMKRFRRKHSNKFEQESEAIELVNEKRNKFITRLEQQARAKTEQRSERIEAQIRDLERRDAYWKVIQEKNLDNSR